MQTYFAYGSNMNLLRVRERGLAVVHAEAASLSGHRLVFDKHTVLHGMKTIREGAGHANVGHANIVYDPSSTVEGVLYWLASVEEIGKMDRFEVAPVNYGRDVVQVRTLEGPRACWTYFANPAVRRAGLLPPRSYLNHLLAGEPYLSAGYLAVLRAWDCIEDG